MTVKFPVSLRRILLLSLSPRNRFLYLRLSVEGGGEAKGKAASEETFEALLRQSGDVTRMLRRAEQSPQFNFGSWKRKRTDTAVGKRSGL